MPWTIHLAYTPSFSIEAFRCSEWSTWSTTRDHSKFTSDILVLRLTEEVLHYNQIVAALLYAVATEELSEWAIHWAYVITVSTEDL